MSFGKRQPGNGPLKPTPFIEYHEISPASTGPGLANAGLSRFLVLSVIVIVSLAAATTLAYSLLSSSRSEIIPVEASLVDGSPTHAVARARLVNICVEHGLLKLTQGDGPTEAQRDSVVKSCACSFAEIADRLSPLQTDMLYVDQRSRLRATMAEIDRTGERIAIDGVPRVDTADGVPVALIAGERYDSHWREARNLAEAQAARCRQ